MLKISFLLICFMFSALAMAQVVSPSVDEELNYGYEYDEDNAGQRSLASDKDELDEEELDREKKEQLEAPSDTTQYWKY